MSDALADGLADGLAEHWLGFEVASAHLAVPADCVDEILELGEVTPVPLAPRHVGGLINLRGDALPLLDLTAFLGLTAPSRPTTVLVTRADVYRVGLLVHRAHGARPLGDRSAAAPARLTQPARLREFALAEIETEAGVQALLDLARLLEAARV